MPALSPKSDPLNLRTADPARSIVAAVKTGHRRVVSPRTLSIDCGGSGIKGSVLNVRGEMIAPRVRVKTPYPLPPDRFVAVLERMAAKLPDFDRATVGVPGMIRNGVVVNTPHYPSVAGPYTEVDPTLVEKWRNWDARTVLSETFGKPTRVLNDAEVQGAAVIKRRGLEVMFTLGTGLGCAIFDNGRLAPHLELSHAPIRPGKTYDLYIGKKAVRELGSVRWSRRLAEVIDGLRPMFWWDRLYVGGGNARRICVPLGDDVQIVPNLAGILGGAKVWDLELTGS